MLNPTSKSARRQPPSSWAAAACWLVGIIGLTALKDPVADFGLYAASMAAAMVGWLLIVEASRAGRITGSLVWAFAVVAVGCMVMLLGAEPAFSGDIHRYVYEGRIVWFKGLGFPFAHPPADGPAQGVPRHLLDASWAQINHPEIPTIYPPLSQLVFALGGGLGLLIGAGTLPILKGFSVAAAAATAAWTGSALESAKRPFAEALTVLACPALLIELARDGHADSVAMAPLALGALGFVRNQPRLGYIGWGLAALAKLNGLVALLAAARSTRRGVVWGLGLCALLAIPFVLAGSAASQGLGAYATRWRAGDGLFSAILWVVEALLGGEWRRFGTVTLTSQQLARAAVAALWLGLASAILRRKPAIADVPATAALLLLLLLLLSPTLHPWYALWLLPLVPFATTGRRAMLALCALAWLNHHAVWLEATTGAWHELAWLRALVHVPVWLLLLVDLTKRAHRDVPAAAG